MITIIIPYKQPEPHLEKTIEEIGIKSKTKPELHVIEDTGKGLNMGGVINRIVKETDSKYIMKLDAHCMVDEGFDQKLIDNSKPNRVQAPKRYKLDPERWEKYGEPVEREQIIFEGLLHKNIRGYRWDEPGDTMHIQCSCWFMEREWFNKCGFLKTKFGGEPTEIFWTTLKNGGETIINTNTWYAHWHKPKELCYPEDLMKSRAKSYDLWVNKHRELFRNLIEKNMPIPGWSENWEKWLK